MRRVATHIRDEDIYLRAQEVNHTAINPHLAHQISIYRMVRAQFNSHHILRIRKIASLAGFTGVASVGVALEALNDGIPEVAEEINWDEVDDSAGNRELLDLQAEQEEQEDMDNDILDILTVSMDAIHVKQ